MCAASQDHLTYDLTSDDNKQKWKGMFVSALEKVQKQVHQTLNSRDDALLYIEDLIVQMLGMLCSAQPHTLSDVEERVHKKILHPMDTWAIAEAQSAVERTKNKKTSQLVFPVDRIHQTLVKEVLGYKIDHQVTIYIVAVLEYIAADILKLTGNYVKNIRHPEISLQDIKVAMCADKVLMEMFFQDDEGAMVVQENIIDQHSVSQSYEEVLKDFILEENQFLRELNMIIRVFREPFVRLYPKSPSLELIFSNILDVQELTQNLISSVEDTVEATEETDIPLIGACFEELAEAMEFDVYYKYAEDILHDCGRTTLNSLLQNSDAVITLESLRRGFKDAVKYVLPRLLHGPIYHFLYYWDTLKMLQERTTDAVDDYQMLEQSCEYIGIVKANIERLMTAKNIPRRKMGGNLLRFQGRASREMALAKMNELQKSIDGWEGKDIGQSCNEYIMEGSLQKMIGKRMTDRYVFLFDGLIILTKQNVKRSSVTGPVGDYKLKEKFYIRKIDIIDREDTDELKNAFDLQVRQHPNIVLVAKSADEKSNWMCALISLLTWSMLERLLDTKMKEEESKQPLRLPSHEQYRFAVDDSDDNIVFEDNQGSKECPLIKGGTLLKLVERLTYHTYADPKFVKTFLTTYRTFCRPVTLLELLMERFDIPEPNVALDDSDNLTDANLSLRDDVKRFRNEYSKPVQFRVLNVVRHWVDQHWYDFEGNEDQLLTRLKTFLESVKGKAMKKWVESIDKIISRKVKNADSERQIQHTMKVKPPSIEWHLTHKPEEFDIMTLHPIEIARQVTLLEFDLYRLVKPSEMVGSVWMKKEKNTTSGNLLRLIQHSTRFTFWLEKCIIEAENFEERIAVLSRIIEVMMVFQELNNFNGVVEVVSALFSASVFRLDHTFEAIDKKLRKALDEAKELSSDHYKRYIERLRSIDPPCVPFLGVYLTNILHTEEGNPDFLPNRPSGIINFSKRRKVAEITAEIQQYQNQPYCLSAELMIRTFFETLNPLDGRSDKEFDDYLYAKSLDLEPRSTRQPNKYERRREYSLKSPGIKPLSRHLAGPAIKNERGAWSLSQLSGNQSGADGEGSELEMGSSSCDATPPTPSTPMTPPHDIEDTNSVFMTSDPASLNEDSVSQFPYSRCTSSSTLCSGTTFPETPPPIPPRTRISCSSSFGFGSTFSVYTSLQPPQLPPRENQPPPLPPRMQSHHSAHGPLVAPPPPPPPPQAVLSHQRRYEAEPQLPPRTYRHSRQSSS